jgi:hypothetical protein
MLEDSSTVSGRLLRLCGICHSRSQQLTESRPDRFYFYTMVVQGHSKDLFWVTKLRLDRSSPDLSFTDDRSFLSV